MNNDFSNVNLYFREKLKLFYMRFHKHVDAEFLGKSLRNLERIKFIQSHYDFIDTLAIRDEKHTVYSLTDRYFRYCVYRRQKFFDSKLWPFIISIVTAIVTSLITAYITSNITVQSVLQ